MKATKNETKVENYNKVPDLVGRIGNCWTGK